MKLSLETRYRAGIVIIHCQGRIVYRDEAAALSRLVSEIVECGGKVVLDLSGVSTRNRITTTPGITRLCDR